MEGRAPKSRPGKQGFQGWYDTLHRRKGGFLCGACSGDESNKDV